MITHFQADFRKGRIGPGLRVRQDAKAYHSGVRDALNMMVTAEGTLRRRWGTLLREPLDGPARIETWDFAEGPEWQFILLFSDETLTIYDGTLTERAVYDDEPWDEESMWFLRLTAEGPRLIITDETFQPRIYAVDSEAGTFGTVELFAFDVSMDRTRLAAPFFAFADREIKVDLTIFTSEGLAQGLAGHIADASGVSTADFNLSLGTGIMKTDRDFFLAEHEGSRLRVLDGELEIVSITGPREAAVKVRRDIARRLDANPFYVRKDSVLVEVLAPGHGLRRGDRAFFFGLSRSEEDLATPLLKRAPRMTTSSTATDTITGGARAYEVIRVVDEDHFEISATTIQQWNAGTSTWDSATITVDSGDLPDNDVLAGGADVYMIPFGAVRGIKEPAFSEARGWPGACSFHETRLWLGGTTALPDAMWGSRFAQYRNFDTGEGGPADAIELYGVGVGSRIRHLLSAFDLIVLCDNLEAYIPGSTEIAITQETARAIVASEHGAAFTRPWRFDGGILFVDSIGRHIREMSAERRDEDYKAPPMTIAVPDWVRGPRHAARYAGSGPEATPYVIWVNEEDGSALVMHSSRQDDAFGFMRWALEDGEFLSVAGLRRRLFAVAVRGEDHWLVEFDANSDSPATTDFSVRVDDTPEETSWQVPALAGETVQLFADGISYSNVTLDGEGNFTTAEPVSDLVVGFPMPWKLELLPPPIQGPAGPRAGMNQRIVSISVHWDRTETGALEDQSVSALDGFIETPPVDDWIEYFVGLWGREAFVTVEGRTPGRAGLRAATMKVHI